MGSFRALRRTSRPPASSSRRRTCARSRPARQGSPVLAKAKGSTLSVGCKAPPKIALLGCDEPLPSFAIDERARTLAAQGSLALVVQLEEIAVRREEDVARDGLPKRVASLEVFDDARIVLVPPQGCLLEEGGAREEHHLEALAVFVDGRRPRRCARRVATGQVGVEDGAAPLALVAVREPGVHGRRAPRHAERERAPA